jgi:hypothetical protein
LVAVANITGRIFSLETRTTKGCVNVLSMPRERNTFSFLFLSSSFALGGWLTGEGQCLPSVFTTKFLSGGIWNKKEGDWRFLL